jgi:hypothetical protein
MNTVSQIKDGLKEFHGSIKALATIGDCTEEWVRLVLNGKSNDDELVLEASKLLKSLRMRRKLLQTNAQRELEESLAFI